MTPELLIYPLVRGWVARLAAIAAGVAMCCAIAAGAELVLAPYSVAAALFAGSLSELLAGVMLVALSGVAWWCHMVLLAGRGMEITRYLMLPVLVLAALLPVCTVYSLVCGELLLPHQADLLLIWAFLWCGCIVLNLPRAKAAGRLVISLVLLFSLALFGYALTNVQPFIWLSDLCKCVACAAIYLPLRRLSRYARLVVSLPPLDAEKS